MQADDIYAEVQEKGYSIFDISPETKENLTKTNLLELTDGFYIDQHEHRSIFVSDSLLTELQQKVKQECRNKYAYNDIFLSRVVEGGSKERYRTHYDSHIYTIVVPVLLPDTTEKNRGQLYLVPKMRKRPKIDLINMSTKLRAFQYRGEKNYNKLKKRDDYLEVDLEVGQAIMFEGMSCLHGNKQNDSIDKRITLISHFVDPFPNGAGAIMRRLRKLFKTRK
jgi:hypothetical protein